MISLLLVASCYLNGSTIDTFFPWKPDAYAVTIDGTTCFIFIPSENKIAKVAKSGNVLKEMDYSKDGWQLVSGSIRANGNLRVYFRDAIHLPVVIEIDPDFSVLKRFNIEKELVFHEQIVFAKQRDYFLSFSCATYDAEFPMRNVAQTLVNMKGQVRKSFSDHDEAGRLYMNSSYSDIAAFIKERVRGIYAQKKRLNFDQKDQVILTDSHAPKHIWRFDPSSTKEQKLFSLPKQAEKKPKNLQAITKYLLHSRVLKVLPNLDLQGRTETLVQEVAADLLTQDLKAPRVWGILDLGNDWFGLVTDLNFETGAQTCLMVGPDGTQKVLRTQDWCLLTPEFMPKVGQTSKALVFTKKHAKRKTVSIEIVPKATFLGR